MAVNPVLSYVERKSFIHELTGTTKLVFFVCWSVASMITFDTRLLCIMFLISLAVFKISRTKFREIKFVVYLALIFLIINNVTVYIFSPLYGTKVYGDTHFLCRLSEYFVITREQLFYMFNMSLKIVAVIPVALVFITCTNPSEFAASLNMIGVSYRIGYAVSLALRYIPDIQRDFHTISQTQEARGIELSGKDSVLVRMKNSAAILLPLILNSLNRIEVISNAMELRGFRKHNKRTWYMKKTLKRKDFASIGFGFLFLAASAVLIVVNGGRFYNPWK